jgi:hypothetical protein
MDGPAKGHLICEFANAVASFELQQFETVFALYALGNQFTLCCLFPNAFDRDVIAVRIRVFHSAKHIENNV